MCREQVGADILQSTAAYNPFKRPYTQGVSLASPDRACRGRVSSWISAVSAGALSKPIFTALASHLLCAASSPSKPKVRVGRSPNALVLACEQPRDHTGHHGGLEAN